MLWSKYILLQEPYSVRRPASGDQEVPVFLAELLQSLKLDRIDGFAGARFLAPRLEKSLLDPTYDFAVPHTEM